ncbi:Uu.00g133440.m01.CDS01 [Anthostomella pinea]|uniref:Uu.00g133440.m01.CDS01 n=1 Tax=Anthostomella pinea TaxID=933095 RepID=A0AAI8YMV4_9PEZI|nr:Uu.00g133440.m01.CDS01 [Anthostomella pinea]
MVGQPGESYYAAANGFLDNLAGLTTTSLVLLMVLAVGVVAAWDSLGDEISRRGVYGVDEREIMCGFQAAKSRCTPTLVARAAVGDNEDIALDKGGSFAGLQPLIDAASGQQPPAQSECWGGSTGFAEVVRAAAGKDGYEAAIQLTAKSIKHKCASILMNAEDDFAVEGQALARMVWTV